MEEEIPTQVIFEACFESTFSPDVHVLAFYRNRVPWITITVIFGISVIMFIALRSYLSWQNEMREKESRDDSYDHVYLTLTDERGNSVKKRVDKVGYSSFVIILNGSLGDRKAFLDITDIQNRDFRYVL